MRLSISVTTRSPRKMEQDGVDYHYWTPDRVREEIARGGFLEWADVFGNYYGTLKAEVDPFRAAGIGVLLEIDVNGWAQVKENAPMRCRSSSAPRRSKFWRTVSAAAAARRTKP